VLNNKLNSLFVLKTLLAPDAPLTLVNISVASRESRLAELVARANSTPQGRARRSLCSIPAIRALVRVAAKPKPGPNDYEAQLDQIAENFAFATAIPVRGRSRERSPVATSRGTPV
jgi:hypothetical protein